MGEPEKAVAYSPISAITMRITEPGSTRRPACTVSIRSSTKCAGGFPAQRPIDSKTNRGRIWNGYSPYDPGNVIKALDIMRIVHNYILTGKDGKTAAERLGLAQAPLDYEDIIYFS